MDHHQRNEKAENKCQMAQLVKPNPFPLSKWVNNTNFLLMKNSKVIILIIIIMDLVPLASQVRQ